MVCISARSGAYKCIVYCGDVQMPVFAWAFTARMIPASALLLPVNESEWRDAF